MKLRLSPFTLLYFALCLLLCHNLTPIAIFTAILIHELTHLIVLWLLNGRVQSLTITPLGLSIERTGLLSHLGETVLSLSAPIVNLVLAVIFARQGVSSYAVVSNLAFGVLNLLPIYPLDGGKALFAILSHLLPQGRAEAISSVVSYAGLLIFWMLAVAIALLPEGNLSPLLLSAGLFLSLAGKDLSCK